MAVPFSNTKLRVPKGFQNILEAFAREVLRSQPENIHEFAAAYFENMMKVRT
ncbi:Sperm surface protein Sp17, partial [Biomphalaria glabrata]